MGGPGAALRRFQVRGLAPWGLARWSLGPWGLALWCLGLAAALTWPAARAPGAAALGSPHADGLKHLWTLWRIRTELREGQVPMQTGLINHPYGLDLYPIEPLNGLLAAALPVDDVIVAANLIAGLNLALVGVCAGWLGWRISGSRAGALASATLMQASAPTLFTLHVGVGELQHVWWVPLGMVAWLRLRSPSDGAVIGGNRHAALLGLALAGATLSCFYHGFFLAASVACASLTTLLAGRATLRLLFRYALAAGLGLAIVLPVLSSFSASYRSEGPPEVGLWSYVTEEHGQPLTDPPSARLEPAHLIQPARARRDPGSREQTGYGGGRYLGAPALLLAALGLAASPRRALPWVASGLVGVVLALGSHLAVDGADLLLDGERRVRLPFLLLNRALGYVAEPVNFPVRFLTMTTTAMAALTGLAAARGPRMAALALGLALLSAVDVQRHQLTPRPMATFSPWDYPELRHLADSEAVLLDFSLAARADVEVRWASMSAQLAHQRPIHGVHIDRVQFFAQEGQRFARALGMVEALGPALMGGAAGAGRYEADVAVLREAGFTHVLVLGVGGSRVVPRALVGALSETLGAPEVDSGAAVLFALPEVDASATQRAQWRAAHAARVAALAADAGFGPQLR